MSKLVKALNVTLDYLGGSHMIEYFKQENERIIERSDKILFLDELQARQRELKNKKITFYGLGKLLPNATLGLALGYGITDRKVLVPLIITEITRACMEVYFRGYKKSKNKEYRDAEVEAEENRSKDGEAWKKGYGDEKPDFLKGPNWWKNSD